MQVSEDTEETESSGSSASTNSFAARAPKRPKTKGGFVVDEEMLVRFILSNSLSTIEMNNADFESRSLIQPLHTSRRLS